VETVLKTANAQMATPAKIKCAYLYQFVAMVFVKKAKTIQIVQKIAQLQLKPQQA